MPINLSSVKPDAKHKLSVPEAVIRQIGIRCAIAIIENFPNPLYKFKDGQFWKSLSSLPLAKGDLGHTR
jgi:hypothetical protein